LLHQILALGLIGGDIDKDHSVSVSAFCKFAVNYIQFLQHLSPNVMVDALQRDCRAHGGRSQDYSAGTAIIALPKPPNSNFTSGGSWLACLQFGRKADRPNSDYSTRRDIVCNFLSVILRENF
jgi:hypothetical protein